MSRGGDVIVSLGCDWITGTTREPDASHRLYEFGESMLVQQMNHGNRKLPWGMKGFSGWSSGSAQLGTRGAECMVRLSSDCAFRHWSKVVQLSQNVSRVDVQVTVKSKTDVHRRIDAYKRAAERNSDRSNGRRIVRWIREHHGGYTLYLGDRKSNVFGRVYDKWQDTPINEYLSCIRFEAQFQKRLALHIATSLEAEPSESSAMSQYLSQFFSDRGIVLELPANSGAGYSCPRKRSDSEKNLIWLGQAVRPCVMRLMSQGLGEEVLKALGLVQETLDNDA